MAIATNDTIVKLGTQKVLESSGASTADAVFVQASDANYVRATDGADAPDATLEASFTFSIAPTGPLNVYAQRLNFAGANDAPAPDASYPHKLIGSIPTDGVTSLQYAQIDLWDLPADCAIWLENKAGQTMSAGWTLDITPKSFGPKV